MKILHILKSEPDDNTNTLIRIISEGEECVLFPLYKGEQDYEKLIDLIFECDKTISWW
ncbi:MAG: hypothetical protein JW896_03510 [Deltaproteobacteria bacterium]|nr:hypothetical protein [Deltaproteobacteria bacterium]